METTSEKIRFDARKPLNCLAHQEGFEPSTRSLSVFDFPDRIDRHPHARSSKSFWRMLPNPATFAENEKK